MKIKIGMQLLKEQNSHSDKPDAILHYTTNSDFIPRIGDTISLQNICFLKDNNLCGVVETVELTYELNPEPTVYIYAGQIIVSDAEMQKIANESKHNGWDFSDNSHQK